MTFQYKSSFSGRTIKRGGGVKPSEPRRKIHFIFYDLKESHEHKNINQDLSGSQIQGLCTSWIMSVRIL